MKINSFPPASQHHPETQSKAVTQEQRRFHFGIRPLRLAALTIPWSVGNPLIVMLMLIWGCKGLQPPVGKTAPVMPAAFSTPADSINSADISWRNYFSDSALVHLIDSALANNFDLLIAFQRIEAARAELRFAKGLSKPYVGAVASAGISKYGEYTMDGAGNKNTPIYQGKNIPEYLPDYYLALQTSWEIDLWGKLKNRRKAATARWLARTEGKNLVITNLISEIAGTYYELLALDQTLGILDGTIALQEAALEIVRVQKEAAKTNELAVKQFEAELLSVRSLRISVAQQIINAESRINFLAGRYPQTIFRDTQRYANTEPPLVNPGLPAALLLNRPDIREAELELLATKSDLLAARAEFFPSLSINGAIGWQAFKPGLLFTTPESIVIGLAGSLATPLINRSAIKASFGKASANQLEALYHYQKTIVNGYLEVYNELNAIRNLQQMVQLKFREAEILTQAIDISTELFKTGRATYLEVLTTQVNALQSKLELVANRRNQFLAAVNVYKALGGGWR